MTARAWRLAAGLALLAAGVAASQAQSPYPPGLGASGFAGFDRYRQLGFNKVFASNADGSWASRQHSNKPIAVLVEEALRACNENARLPCHVMSVNDRDTAGRDPLSLPAIESAALGPFVPGPYYPIRGPQAAAGLLIWSHGVLPGDDNTRHAPQGYVNRLRDAGYDVYKFDRRLPDYNKDLGTLRAGVEAARKSGYRRIILAGQSVGAWLSLEAAAKGAPVDGVIAAAPARFGKEIGTTRRERNREDLIPVLEALAGRDLPVVVMFFALDEFDPGGRGPYAQTLFSRPVRARAMVIDGPVGITGHGGAATAKFVLEYGACIAAFLLQEKRDAPCA